MILGTRVDTGTFTRQKKGKEPKRRIDYAKDIDIDEPVMPKPVSHEDITTNDGGE